MAIPLLDGALLVEVDYDDSPEARAYGDTVRLTFAEECPADLKVFKAEMKRVSV